MDSPLCEVIHTALADLPSGRVGSFQNQVICTLVLPSSMHTPKYGPPIPHDKVLREVVDEAVRHITHLEESYGHGPVPHLQFDDYIMSNINDVAHYFNKLLANLNSGPLNQKHRKNTNR